jgi:hypothetical protein
MLISFMWGASGASGKQPDDAPPGVADEVDLLMVETACEILRNGYGVVDVLLV